MFARDSSAAPSPRSAWLALPVALVLSACASTEPAPATPPPPSAAPEDQPDPPLDDGDDDANGQRPAAPKLGQKYADETARQIMAELAQARALSADGKWAVDVIDKAGVRDFVKTALYEDMTPEELLLLGKIQAALGVLPPDVEPEKVLLDMYEEGVLGIYDPKTETLLIGDYVLPSMLEMVVGHELAHGIQDMHFDLEALQEPLRVGPHSGLTDAETARTFLVEGDAQATYLTWRGGPAGPASIEDDVLDVMADQALGIDERFTPYPTLARMMQMPYTDGTATVLRLARTRGWPAVDALFGELPETSEQMLHLDKLLKREPAKIVEVNHDTLSKAVGGHPVVWEDDLGEAALLAMIADVESPSVARSAADGWGGDRFVALRAADAPADAVPTVVGLVAWDTEDDARAFESSMRRYFAENVDGSAFLERKRDRVLFATYLPEGVDPKKVSAAAWPAFKVKRGKRGRG